MPSYPDLTHPTSGLLKSLNHSFTVGAGANPLDLDSDEILDIIEVISCLLGEIVVGLRVSGRLVPSGHLVVDNLSAVEDVEICRVCSQLLAGLGILVRNGDLDRLEGVENIKLGEVQCSVVVAVLNRTTTKSSQPQRRFLPVEVPHSRPTSWSFVPTSPRSSVLKLPIPFRVV